MGSDQREAINLDAICQCEIQLLGTEPKISPSGIPSATRAWRLAT